MKIYIETYGCSANISNSEIMGGLLREKGFSVVDDIDKSDIIIVNTCTVKGKTQNKIIRRISDIVKDYKNKKLIVAGCMPEAQKELVEKTAPKASLIGPYHVEDIIKVIDGVVKNKKIILLGKRKEIKLCLPKIRKNSVINITQICEGCSGYCSYCIVKFAKGELGSYPAELVVEEIKKSLEEGCKEIWLTSQDNAAYGRDIKSNLAELLKKIVNDDEIKNKEFFIRIGMMNPNNIIPFADDLINIYKNNKIFKFIHVPVQSGNDEILKSMNRKYSVSDFVDIVNKFRKEIKNITVSTDIIVGFPGETQKQFEESLELIKKIKPDVLNISRFWPRPGTKAACMKQQVSGDVTKKRSKILTSIFNEIALENNRKWVGWEGNIIIDEKGKDKSFVGRNICYKPVVVNSNKNIIGKTIKVKIQKAETHYLMAKFIK